MSDKTPVQQELAQNIAQLVHCFRVDDAALMFQFVGTFFKTMRREWLGLDKYRYVCLRLSMCYYLLPRLPFHHRTNPLAHVCVCAFVHPSRSMTQVFVDTNVHWWTSTSLINHSVVVITHTHTRTHVRRPAHYHPLRRSQFRKAGQVLFPDPQADPRSFRVFADGQMERNHCGAVERRAVCGGG
jgi:hypothetical protein